MIWHYYTDPNSSDGSPPGRAGARTLVLLHGIGMSHAAWKFVIPLLAKKRRVFAFDIPGFGDTEPLPEGDKPTPAKLAASLKETLEEIKEIDLRQGVDIVGNSLGGFIALEAAKSGLARNVVAFSPAGLWQKKPPMHIKPVLLFTRFAVYYLTPLTHLLLKIPPVRALLMAIPVSIKSWRMSSADAIKFAKVFARADRKALKDTGEGLREPFKGGKEISRDVPITIIFGTRDWLITSGGRMCHELPDHTRWIDMPGSGHVPMLDNPACAAALILEGTELNGGDDGQRT